MTSVGGSNFRTAFFSLSQFPPSITSWVNIGATYIVWDASVLPTVNFSYSNKSSLIVAPPAWKAFTLVGINRWAGSFSLCNSKELITDIFDPVLTKALNCSPSNFMLQVSSSSSDHIWHIFTSLSPLSEGFLFFLLFLLQLSHTYPLFPHPWYVFFLLNGQLFRVCPFSLHWSHLTNSFFLQLFTKCSSATFETLGPLCIQAFRECLGRPQLKQCTPFLHW